MIKMNVNAMTNGEIVAQYRALEKQVTAIIASGRGIVGVEIKERMATLKERMEALGLT